MTDRSPWFPALVEGAIAQDRAVYEAAGIVLIERCYWCRSEFDPSERKPKRTRERFTFDSDACRQAWRRASHSQSVPRP